VVIRQFDVFANPSLRSRDEAPFVIVLQSHHAGELPTVVVAPLYRREVFPILTRLTVEVERDGQDLIVSIPELVALSSTLLHKKVGSMVEHEDAIRRALDRLFTGF
jgi:toxin CcdB